MTSEAEITFFVDGFKEKEWKNPSNTSSRLYIHKIDGERKIECGYLDLNSLTYCGPDKRRKYADHNIIICETNDNKESLVHVATVKRGEESIDLHYKNEEGLLEVNASTQTKNEPNNDLTIPEPLVDDEQEQIESLSLSHIASITKSKSKIVISYANTVEVAPKGRGYIRSQYPKFSLQVELEGGDVVNHINEAADEVVRLVEERLTAIVNEITKES